MINLQLFCSWLMSLQLFPSFCANARVCRFPRANGRHDSPRGRPERIMVSPACEDIIHPDNSAAVPPLLPHSVQFHRRFCLQVHDISRFPSFWFTPTDCCLFFMISRPWVHLLFNEPTVSNLKTSLVCLLISWFSPAVSEASLTGGQSQLVYSVSCD